MFAGKGTIQIGKGNQAVSGVTTGDVAGPVAVGTGNVINYHNSPPPEKTVEFLPSAAEVEILLALAKSPTGYLNAFKYDGGFAVSIAGKTFGGPDDPGSSVSVHEAVQRLLKVGLLSDIQHNGEIYHLSSKGKEAVQQLQKQIGSDGKAEFAEIEQLMPELLAEMKQDYAASPLIREMILLDSEGNVYNGGGVFIYRRSKHPDLDAKMQILENHGLVEEITNDNTDRYRVKERFARYLTGK